MGVADVPEAVTSVQLYSATPNPFNPSTRIRFALPQPGRVRLSVFDLGGRLVSLLADEVMTAGHHQVVWTGCDQSGKQVSSGTYFSRLEADGVTLTGRMTLLK